MAFFLHETDTRARRLSYPAAICHPGKDASLMATNRNLEKAVHHLPIRCTCLVRCRTSFHRSTPEASSYFDRRPCQPHRGTACRIASIEVGNLQSVRAANRQENS